MTSDQIISWAGGAVLALFGGGGIWAFLTALAKRKVGIKTTENEANKTISTSWGEMVENLQEQLTFLAGEVAELKKGQKELQTQLGIKERLLLRAIAFIGILELLIPEGSRPKRPEGLE